MTVSLKHAFQSAKSDGADSSLVQPSNWNAEHTLTLATNKLIGRATAGTGAAEEIAIGTALSMSGGTLAVTTVPVANGGTGATSLTANNVLLGNGTSAVQVVAPSTSGNVLTSNGTTWVSQAPTAATTTYELISTSNASGASTVDFTGLSTTYMAYVVEASGIYLSSTTTFFARTSSNNGSSWDSGATDYGYSTISVDTGSTVGGSSAQSSAISLGSISTSTYGNYFTLRLINAGVSRPAAIDATTGIAVPVGQHTRTVGFRSTTTAVNGLRLYPSTGTVTGTFKLYGVRA